MRPFINFYKLVEPKAFNEDLRRREFIFNILILAVISLLLAAIISSSINYFFISDSARKHGTVSFIALFFELIVFGGLYLFSRKGYFIFASYILLFVLFLLSSYIGYRWGIDSPFGLLAYALVIIMCGILINTRFAFFITSITVATMISVGYLQQAGIIAVNQYWRSETLGQADIIMFAVIFLIIAIVSWLSNREIEKSLTRARRSEVELKKERDSLEITVEARTRELKETQAEKMTQLYRFAEFGRLSSGLFHDLINPLTAVSLNIEKVKNAEVSEYVDKAIVAARKMEDMVSAVRKQLSRQETKTFFSVNEEIAQALEVLSYKAQKSRVAIRLFSREDLKTYGDAVKFNQVALNLVANAIDAYLPAGLSAVALAKEEALPRPSEALREGGAKEGLEKRNSDTRPVTMSLSQEGGVIIFEVKDRGIGISGENKPKLFEPFFTTKKEGYGLGIGLSMTKRIIEKDFGGSISVESPAPEQARYGAGSEGGGSVFTVKFPQKDKEFS